jgi:hypothetical protein
VGTYLLVMLAFAAACFYENEAFGSFDVLIAQRATLSMLDGEIVTITIYIFKCGKNLG